MENGRRPTAERAAVRKSRLCWNVVPKPGEGPLRKHYITNIIVTLADEDRASARSDYLLIRTTSLVIVVADEQWSPTFGALADLQQARADGSASGRSSGKGARGARGEGRVKATEVLRPWPFRPLPGDQAIDGYLRTFDQA